MIIKRIKILPTIPMLEGLTVGQLYRVLSIECGDYRVVNDEGVPSLYPAGYFEITDPRADSFWEYNSDPWHNGCCGPREFICVGFFEDYFDGVQSAVATYTKIMQTHYLK